MEPINRREALAQLGSVAIASTVPTSITRLLDGPIRNAGQASLIPADKGFDSAWLAGLRRRGRPEVYKGDELRWIGMPVGGLCCGQVYLGGDGRLWHWDVFNQRGGGDTQGTHYAKPMVPASPIDQSFQLKVGGQIRSLDATGFPDTELEQRYPVGVVRFRDAGLSIQLQAFSPFIPLETDDSSMPITVMRYTIRNDGTERMKGSLIGKLANPVGTFSGNDRRIRRRTRLVQVKGLTAIHHDAIAIGAKRSARPDIVFADFEGPSYAPWTVEGDAFGTRPFLYAEVPDRKQPTKGTGKGLVNTHESRKGQESELADTYVGTLTSPTFAVERPYICFLIGGGNHPGETCVDLLVEGKVVRTATGRNANPMRRASWDVREFAGKSAQIRIVDQNKGGWGHITVDAISFCDVPWEEEQDPESLPDFGSMALGSTEAGTASPGMVEVPFELAPGQSRTITFLLAWYFPNLTDGADQYGALNDFPKLRKHYGVRFRSALDVISAFAEREDELVDRTLAFADTWYDSTLPHWFLGRTLIPVACLATATAQRFSNGRFYGWEGVYCCPGTCQHVWNYAQASGRLFPELERHTREHTDFGLAWQADGTLHYRGEYGRHMAHDGQAGTIIRTFREHSTSPDGSWLKRIWPKVKTSIERLAKEDRDGDGVIDTWQYNTLDDAWAGEISWISSMYLAALRCGAEMARDMGDAAFAASLDAKIRTGVDSICDRLFDGEYFVMKRDPAHPEALGYGPACHVDQVFGDSLLHQVGLDPVLPREKVKSALRALHKYNFAPDAGTYRNTMQAVLKGGRWYAMPGEPGLVMTTFPKGGAEASKGKGHPDWIVGYYNECMNGFEYQAAAHMIAEGLLDEGLTVVRSLHDRYAPSKRNPYNEIECSDHYARSMASYGAFLTLCGFSFHGPRRSLRFDPKLAGPFRAPFVCGEGWGTVELDGETCQIDVRHGRLRLRELSVPIDAVAAVNIGGKPVAYAVTASDHLKTITFRKEVVVRPGAALSIVSR